MCFTHHVIAEDSVKVYQYQSEKGISSFSDIAP
ncbi:MAG: hypothetical protein ACI9O3_001367 [Colwellia sp.]|jgi:hypothetical protein